MGMYGTSKLYLLMMCEGLQQRLQVDTSLGCMAFCLTYLDASDILINRNDDGMLQRLM